MRNDELSKNYKSNSQIARVLSENWFSSEMYCPCCLNKRLDSYPNNKKAIDFYCDKCKNDFQLKSLQKPIGRKIIDGEYNTMLGVIERKETPNIFLLQYAISDWAITSLLMIPKYFITQSMLEKRTPLSETARRAGWTGCNFLLDRLPLEGKIPIIIDNNMINRNKVNKIWSKMNFLADKKPDFRGWTSDVLKVVQEQKKDFQLNDIYKYEDYFKRLHPENNNIKAKIRQQLQVLRDNNIIRFKERGFYEVVT